MLKLKQERHHDSGGEKGEKKGDKRVSRGERVDSERERERGKMCVKSCETVQFEVYLVA